MSENSAIIKIIAEKTREYTDLFNKYSGLGAAHVALVNDYADCKILCAQLSKENKRLKKLSEEQREEFVDDLKFKGSAWISRSELIKKWEARSK